MIQNYKGINFWYYVFGLILAIVLISFFIGLNKTENIETINQADKSLATDLNPNLDLKALNKLGSRLQISDFEFSRMKTYKQLSDIRNRVINPEQPSNNEIMDEPIYLVPNTEFIRETPASSSGELTN